MTLLYWREFIIGSMMTALGVLWLLLQGAESRADKWQARSGEWQAAHDSLADRYRAAAELAKAQQDARNAEKAARQQTVSLEEVDAYRKRIADLERLYAGSVRAGKAKADTRLPGANNLPGIPDASSGSDLTAPPDSLACALNTAQLEALIAWIKAQAELSRPSQ